MYRVAICDDEPVVRDDIAKRCEAVLAGWGIPCGVAAFASAEELETALTNASEPFDLLLLDIQLPGKNGVALGAALRGSDDGVGIIFITGSAAYALEGYKAQPCNYLLKPVSDAALADAIRIELKRHNKHQIAVFKDRGREVRLPAADIRYLESRDHGIHVHTPTETLYFAITLAMAKDMLPPGMFIRCHNSYIVNLSCIMSASSTRIILRGGEQLPVGRTYGGKFHSVFIDHFFG